MLFQKKPGKEDQGTLQLSGTTACDSDTGSGSNRAMRTASKSRAAKGGGGGFKRGGFPIWTCPSFLVLFCFVLGLSQFLWDFPDLFGDSPGIFPICPFPLSRPINSTYEEQSRKGPRHNLDLSQKGGKHPGLETPGLASLKQQNTNLAKERPVSSPHFSLIVGSQDPTVRKGHEHRVTTPEKPQKILRTPAEPCRAPQNPWRDPRRAPQSPLRGKFPRRALRRVVPLAW